MTEVAKKNKRMFSITFTGKELLGNTAFDTNDEKAAKSNNLFDEKKTYKPLTIITGERELMPLVENELESMSEGEERIVKLLAKDAFGERKSELLRVIPLQNFHEQKINPFPGLVLRIGDALGKVQSVGSGRVRIDFNHPLAGHDIEYTVRLEKEFKDKKEISEQLYSKYYSRIPGTTKEMLGDTMHITLEGTAFKNLTKVNEAIAAIANELGVKLEFKEGAAIAGVKAEGFEDAQKNAEEEHSHSHTGADEEHAHEHTEHDHSHGHYHSDGSWHDGTHEEENHSHKAEEKRDVEISGPKVAPAQKGINQIQKEMAGSKKSSGNFEVTKDTASTIQRPKKKQY